MNCYSLLFIAFIALSCNLEKKYDPSTYSANTPISENAVYSDTSFRQTITLDTLQFKIYTLGHGNKRELVIFVERNGLLIADVKQEIDGTITGARIADLNKNNIAELILIGKKGKSDVAQVLGYEISEEQTIAFELPSISNDPQYRGNDKIDVLGDILTRTYPRGIDEKTVSYILDKNQFVIYSN